MPPVTTAPKIRSRIRPLWVNVPVSAEERQLFHRIANASGLALTELVRVSVLAEGIRLGVDAEGQQHQQQEAAA